MAAVSTTSTTTPIIPIDDTTTSEKRGEKRHADDNGDAAVVAVTPSSGENKDEVKQPITKKAKNKKKKDGSATGTDAENDNSEAGKKARGLAKSQRANKLALGIPDKPEGLEIFNLVRPVDIPAAFDFFKSIGSPKYVVAPMV